jgi:hypothetical protein
MATTSIHETVRSLIQTTAMSVNPDGRFVYGRDIFQSHTYGGNTRASDADGNPLISLLPFIINWTSEGAESVYNGVDISMVFSRSADPQDTAERESAIMDEMGLLAENFMEVLDNANIPIQYAITNTRMQGENQFWLGTNTGVVVTFTLNILKAC